MNLNGYKESDQLEILNGAVTREKALWTSVLILSVLFLGLGLWNWNIELRASRDRLALADLRQEHHQSVQKINVALDNLTSWNQHLQDSNDSLRQELGDARSFAATEVLALQTINARLMQTNADVDRLAASDAGNTEWLNELEMEHEIFRPQLARLDSLADTTAAITKTLVAKQKINEVRISALSIVPRHRSWWPW